jgi:hypothetical protein
VRTRIIGIGLLGAFAGALALTGGCGGGNARLDARQYVIETSAVCVRANRAVARIARPSLDHAVRMASTTARVIAIHRESIDSLRALRPPKDFENMAKLWIALVDQSIDELDAMRVALHEGHESAATSYAEKAVALEARSRVIARTHGITPCKVPELIA